MLSEMRDKTSHVMKLCEWIIAWRGGRRGGGRERERGGGGGVGGGGWWGGVGGPERGKQIFTKC